MLYLLGMRYGPVRGALLAATILATVLARPARADGVDTIDLDAQRIATAGHPLKWNWTPPGHNQRFGHAETLIHAPVETVRRLVIDFNHYTQLAPQAITTSRVVAHGTDGSTDVYLRMGVLNNTFTLWNVTRFGPVRLSPEGGETVEGQMVPGKGNIDDSAFMWNLRAAGEGWTVLKFDIELRPGVPAPQWLIDEQLRDSAMDAVNSIHDRAQGSKAIGPYPG